LRRLQGEATYLSEKDVGEETREESAPSTPERLLIKKLGREFLVQTRDIEWVEASGNYANLHIKNSIYPMRITMDKLEKCLPENFARIHRSTIVNLNRVKQLEALDSGDYEISLQSGVKLALSRRYRESFKNLHSVE
jgi:DNA-binding LytR/AlgR family response regulator